MSAAPRPGDHLRAQSGREYRVRAWHAEGSYARVFRGEAVSPPRACALKIAKTEILGAGPRLAREIEIRERFRHRGVPEFLDAGCAGDAPFLATTWVEGPTLRAHVERLRRLPLVGAIRLLRDVAEVVAHMHSQGLAHGDLRPDNVLVSQEESGARAVVTDLGETRPKGDPAFESTRAEDLRHLGRLLYVMLTGVTPEQEGGRLSRANGHHPDAVRLWETAGSGAATASTVLRDLETFLRTLVRG